MKPADQQKIEAAEQITSAAVRLLKMQMPIIEEVLAMRPAPDDEEHRAVDSLLRPILEAARNLVRAHDAQVTVGKAALAAVTGQEARSGATGTEGIA